MDELFFDVVVIGSGFGGSVMTHRLTEKGNKVCLLERGSEYPMYSFPRRVHEIKEKLFWEPEKNKFGYMEIRDDAGSDFLTITGSGLGGGSLIYANVLLRLQKEYFQDWPFKIDNNTLEPYYKKVLDIMDASPYPVDKDPYYQDTPKTNIYRETVEKLPLTEDMLAPAKLIKPDLAINFKGDFPGEQTINKHGKLQSKCNKCGACDIGCNIHAKNTLDHNYLHLARKNGATIKTNSEVIDLLKKDDYYIVRTLNPISKKTSEYYAKKVVFSAGAIGSTRLLLKIKSQGHLPNISEQLGNNLSGNGDFLAYSNFSKPQFDPTNGPVITTAVEYKMKPYPDGYRHVMYLEDAGAPIGLAWYLTAKVPSIKSFKQYFKFFTLISKRYLKKIFKINQDNAEVNLGEEFSNALDNDDVIRNMFVHLAMGRDRNTGKMIYKDGEARVHWDIKESALHFNRVQNKIKEYTKIWGGTYMENPFMHINKIFAVHPLGGCIMGESIESGVVDENGEIYGHPGLYVVDGSIIPSSLGPNPSLTIAAMAERIAERF